MTHTITLMPQPRTFEASAKEPVLNAALRAGINLPHSCKGGSCGLCKGKLLAGAVTYPFGRPVGLTAEEEAQGYTLLCEAHAQGDLTVDIREIQLASEAFIHSVPCRVARKQLLAPDVMALFLQLPVVEQFRFVPGQYLDVMLPGERRRSFSIASLPGDQWLELHVRRAPGGEFSQQVFEKLREQALLRIEGPLGQFVYREDPKPMVLVGGGTGFAPLKAIIRHVLENKLPRRMHLYWGARTQQDLYEDALVNEWVRGHENLLYTPVLSEPDVLWAGRSGFVHQAMFEDYADLSGVEVYASGPPAMVEAIKQEGPGQGLELGSLHFDSFEYAPDTLRKMRSHPG